MWRWNRSHVTTHVKSVDSALIRMFLRKPTMIHVRGTQSQMQFNRNSYRLQQFWVYSMTLNSHGSIIKPHYSFLRVALSLWLQRLSYMFIANSYIYDSRSSNTYGLHSTELLLLVFSFFLILNAILFYFLFSFRFVLISTFSFSLNFSILAFSRLVCFSFRRWAIHWLICKAFANGNFIHLKW